MAKSRSVQMRIESVERRLDLYYQAEEAVLNAQRFRIGSQEVTLADLSDIRKIIKELEAELDALQTRGSAKRRVGRVTFYD